MKTSRLTTDELCGLDRLLRRHAEGQESDAAVLAALKARGRDLVFWARLGLTVPNRADIRRNEATASGPHSPAQWFKDL